jgi:hypothetical protein
MRSTVLALALVSTLSAGIYDYGYTPLSDVSAAEKNNPLYYGDYERIIRYDAIGYTPGNPVQYRQRTIRTGQNVRIHRRIC